MDSNVLGPVAPSGHDFSQLSQSSRSVTNDSLHEHSQAAMSANADDANRLEVEVEEPHHDDAGHGRDDDDVDVDGNGEEEEANTQETFTQQLTQGNDLTQLGFGDDDDDENGALSQSQDCTSPTPIDPLTLPWGRLMPVALNANDAGNNTKIGNGNGNAAVQFHPRPNLARGALEMLPRSPTRAGSVTRSRSPSMGSEKGGGRAMSASMSAASMSPPCIHFLGLKNLLPSDRFNDYVLGRSVKADVMAQKMEVPPSIPTEQDAHTQARNQAKRKQHDYVHAMISNRHCRIYCLLSNVTNNARGRGMNNDSDNDNGTNCGSPEMEVFVEDTSGNGTLVNGTTLLRRNERRKLHTGDVICLLNPKLLSKKLRSVAERKTYMSQYSYVFVNLYEQEARHGWGVMSTMGKGRNNGRSGDLASPVSTKKGAVNARATKCHSIENAKSKRSLFSESTCEAATKSNHPRQQLPPSKNNNSSKLASASLGSFLNNSNTQTSSRQRRIEEEYDLRDLLGTGTCGEVRRAIHRRTGEERAVKIISIGGRGGSTVAGGTGMSSEKLSAIRAEAEILRSLDHPYCVKLFDMFVAPGKAIYLVMECIKGGDLFDRIVEKERYTEVQARRLLRRILTAVHYLHEERGIVHRDLKPENILVVDRRSDFNIKLTDFGLAKNMTAEGLKTFCGTPQYFAPEVLRRSHTVKGNGRYGKEIDCWSIGVILFILLSGSPPFDVSAGFDAVADARVVFYEDQWRSISSEARDLVMRLLQKDPRRRMSVKEACEHPWVLVEDGDTHCHPLHDPLVARSDRATMVSANSKMPAKRNDDNSTSSNQDRSADNSKSGKASGTATGSATSLKPPPKPPSSPRREACGPANSNTLSPITMHNKQTSNHGASKFQSLSAPQLSKDGTRQPSIWPTHNNDQTVTKAIEQSCHTSQPSPNGSPIKKRQLFDKNNEPCALKKMSKHDVEWIKAAGNTLPNPVINEESRLVKKSVAPKKKVQSTLFSASADSINKKQCNSSKLGAQLPEKDRQNTNKRKSWTSTVTPPGGNEQNNGANLVFRLNKKHKVGGKTISPDPRGISNSATASASTITAAAVAAPVKRDRSELSEDELESDFSDGECNTAVGFGDRSLKSEKKPLEKFLRKRKMDSIESSASVDRGSKKPQQQQKCTRWPLQEEVPRPVSKESCDDKKPPTHTCDRNPNDSAAKSKDRKKKQSFLFGKSPPNDGLPIDSVANLSARKDGPAVENDHSHSSQMQSDAGTGIQRQSSELSAGGNHTSPKGKQRSIKSWFRPKK